MPLESIVGVRELRQNLSVYLARVKNGESLRVTEHHRIVAVLRPADAAEGLIDRLVADGRATPAIRRPPQLPRPLRLARRARLSDILEELREDGV